MKLPKSLTTVTPLSKALALILFFLLPILGFYLGMKYQQALIFSHSISLIENTSSDLDIEKSDTTNWLDYKNNTWGFELKLPPTWEGYLVSEHNWTTNPTHEYTADICIYFKRFDSIPACILHVSVFSAEELQAVSKKGALPNLLGQSNQFFFAANEYDPQCAQLDSFQCDRSKELPEILSTFKLNAKE
ncbi:MAG TPA: hypothetical protein VD999_03795 [Vitreimonas sp.]|nr:hypothetical protein [Vitreimonas sp.]